MQLNKLVLSFASLFFLGTVTNAKIYEIKHISEAIKYASSLHFNSPVADEPISANEILLAFDIDNTIGGPENEIASDQCFSKLLESKVALHKVLKICHSAQKVTELKPVEETRFDADNPDETILGTLDTINFLQHWGFKTMALTARSQNIYESTLRQFASSRLKIDFTSSSPYPKATYPGSIVTFNETSDAKGDCRYFNGILFCGNHNKGEKLIQLLRLSNYHPKAIILIDDKRANLEKVEAALKSNPAYADIIFIGLRYGACDEAVSKFNLAAQLPQISAIWRTVASRPGSPLFAETIATQA